MADKDYSRARLSPDENAQHREMWSEFYYKKLRRLDKATRRKAWFALLSVFGTLAAIASVIRDWFWVKN